jgi:hypothetical protein
LTIVRYRVYIHEESESETGFELDIMSQVPRKVNSGSMGEKWVKG